MTNFHLDPRARAYLEAEECLRQAQNLALEDPKFWANLLGGVANASVAAVPDSVMEDVWIEMARREQLRGLSQKRVQQKIKEDLNPAICGCNTEERLECCSNNRENCYHNTRK